MSETKMTTNKLTVRKITREEIDEIGDYFKGAAELLDKWEDEPFDSMETELAEYLEKSKDVNYIMALINLDCLLNTFTDPNETTLTWKPGIIEYKTDGEPIWEVFVQDWRKGSNYETTGKLDGVNPFHKSYSGEGVFTNGHSVGTFPNQEMADKVASFWKEKGLEVDIIRTELYLDYDKYFERYLKNV
jgi:hypothetical protein